MTLLLSGVLSLLSPAIAAAGVPADTLTPPAMVADTSPPLTLDPLLVTVLRSSLDLMRVPAAVSVTDTEAAARAGTGLGLDDPLRAIPGLQIDNRYNYSLGERVSIRGFGARTQFGVRGIRVIVDGLPATLPDGQTAIDHVDLAGVGRAEVLRGASSSLYGNAAGGVIQLASLPPPGSHLRQELRTVLGTDGLRRFESRTGGSIGRIWYGVAATRLSYDGYREHSEALNHYASARIGYRGDRDDLRFTIRYVDLDALNPGALSDSLLALDPARAFPNNIVQRTGKASSQLQVGASWRRSLGTGELEALAYHLGRDVMNPTPPQVIDIERVVNGARVVYSGQIEVDDVPFGNSPGGADLYWSIGFEADRQRDDRQNHQNQQGERGPLALDQLEWVTGLGLFGQLSAPLTTRISALAGLRYDHFDFEVDDRFQHVDGTDLSGSRTMAALSPSVGLILATGEGSGFYANLGTSFQTPTTTELANRPDAAGGFNPELQPERTRSFEVGLRGRGGLRYQLALYHATTTNALIGFEVPTVPGRTFYRNAGSAVHRGLEAEAATELGDDVVVRISYTYTDAYFDDYQVGSEILDGNRIPGIAPHRAEARVTHHSGLGHLELWARALSRTHADDANSATSPGYALAGARASLEPVRIAGLEVRPFLGIDNIFDRDYVAALAINAFGGRYYEPGPGRTVFVGASVAAGGR